PFRWSRPCSPRPAPPGTRRSSSSPTTSTWISPPRSPAWRRCSPPSHPSENPVTRSIAFVTLVALTPPSPPSTSSPPGAAPRPAPRGGPPAPAVTTSATPPSPDPRIGLRAGLTDPGEAAWNLRVLSQTPPSQEFQGVTNSDLAFTGKYAIQGSYNGWQVWDISD